MIFGTSFLYVQPCWAQHHLWPFWMESSGFSLCKVIPSDNRGHVTFSFLVNYFWQPQPLLSRASLGLNFSTLCSKSNEFLWVLIGSLYGIFLPPGKIIWDEVLEHDMRSFVWVTTFFLEVCTCAKGRVLSTPTWSAAWNATSPARAEQIPGFSPCYAQGIAHCLQKAGVQESYRDLAHIPTHPEHSLSSRNAGWLRNTEGRLFPERKPSGPSSRRKGPHSWLPQFRVQWTPWFTYHKLLNFLIEILFLQ